MTTPDHDMGRLQSGQCVNENETRRCLIDLILWAEPDKLQTIWSFVRSYLRGEIVGVHAGADYLIEHGKFLQAKRRREARDKIKGEVNGQKQTT